MGTVGVTATVISAAAPLTALAGVAPIALMIGGVGVPGAYLFAGIVLTVFAIGFTAMAAEIRRTGGFFVYIGHAFGGTAGFAAAVLAIVSYNLLQIGVYGLFGLQTRAALDDLFGVTAPWWLIAAIAVVLVFVLGALGIDVGAKVLIVLITLETAILTIMGVAIIAQGGAGGLGVASFEPDNIFNSGVLAVLGICFAAFMGFESTALYRAEARDPARTIPVRRTPLSGSWRCSTASSPGPWCRRSARLASRPGPVSWVRGSSSPQWTSTSARGRCTPCTS